jgi:hypothetical protein
MNLEKSKRLVIGTDWVLPFIRHPPVRNKNYYRGRPWRDVISSRMYVCRTTGCRRRAKAYPIITHYAERTERNPNKNTHNPWQILPERNSLAGRVRSGRVPPSSRTATGNWTGCVVWGCGAVGLSPSATATWQRDVSIQICRTENRGGSRKAPGRLFCFFALFLKDSLK